MKTETMKELRDGDVFRFQYSEEVWKRANGRDLNWCFDGQVVVRDGKLCDTYWGFKASEPRIVRPDEGTLTFVCNLNDVRDVSESETRHYAEADVFNLTYQHGCYKRFVVQKDAERSTERILAEIDAKERAVCDDMERAVRSGACDLMQLGKLRAKVESGDPSARIWW